MVKTSQASPWLTAVLIFVVPILFIFFLGSQMAYSQVKRQFEPYQALPEVNSLLALETRPAGQEVLLRGRIAGPAAAAKAGIDAPKLLIYQVRPAGGREVRFQEEFPLIFPEFVMALPDGTVEIVPSSSRAQVIYAEPHRRVAGEYEQTGFQVGDTVLVQGEWQPGSGAAPALVEVTGISGSDRASLMAGWRDAFQKVSWARNILGLLTMAGLIWLIRQLRQTRQRSLRSEEGEAWQSQTSRTVPTT